MQIQKHDAMNGRFYEINGEFLPSSTTILNAYPLEYGLKEFFQTNTKYEAEKIRHDAELSGSKIHHAIDLILQGIKISPIGFTDSDLENTGLVLAGLKADSELIAYLRRPFTTKEDTAIKAFVGWFDVYKPIPLETEKTVFSRKHRYAGTLDFLGYIHVQKTVKRATKGKKVAKTVVLEKQLAIIDWKTGKGLYQEYDLQLSSYWQARREMGLKAPIHVYILHLGTNHKVGYNFKQVEKPADRFKEFQNIHRTWKMINPNAKPEVYEFAEHYSVAVDRKAQKELVKKFNKKYNK